MTPFVKVAFQMHIDHDATKLIEEIINLKIDGKTDDELSAAYRQTSEAFRASFPDNEGHPFSAYKSLFIDPGYTRVIASFAVFSQTGAYNRLYICGDMVDCKALANILQIACPNHLPTGFSYIYGTSLIDDIHSGGGHVIIEAHRITFIDSKDALKRDLAALDPDTRNLVLATCSKENGLDFWNNANGFGPLGEATVFTPDEAANFDVPIANDEPEWLTMPAPNFKVSKTMPLRGREEGLRNVKSTT